MGLELMKRKLKQIRKLDLDALEFAAMNRIGSWLDYCRRYDVDKIPVVSYSGGINSSVLLHLVRRIEPNIMAVNVDTGLEYREVKAHVRNTPNVEIIHPDMTFSDVIKTHGYPVVSKKVSRFVWDLRRDDGVNDVTKRLRMTGINSKGEYQPALMLSKKWRYLVDAPFLMSDKCCHIMKSGPLDRFYKEYNMYPFIGLMASESADRERQWMRNGCNVFGGSRPSSRPLSMWTQQHMLAYVLKYDVPYPSVYGDIIKENGQLTTSKEKRTGCCFCLFGIGSEKGCNRFQRMAFSHPKEYRYCINGGVNMGTEEKPLWVPSKEGLGLGRVMDYLKVPYKPCKQLEIKWPA